MKNYVYVVYDRVAQESCQLMYFKNDLQAVRVYDKSMAGHQYVQDFSLYKIGTYDPETMLLQGMSLPELVVTTSPSEVKNGTPQ